VVGGGIIGLSIALELAKEKQRVRVLERARPFAEASSAAAGILAPQAEAHAPGPLLDLGVASFARYESFARELEEASDTTVSFARCGVLDVCFDEKEDCAAKERARWQEALGLRAEQLSAEATLCLEPGLAHDVVGAVHFPDAGQVDNRRLGVALETAARRMGVEIVREEVLRIEAASGRALGVSTSSGTVHAGATVVASGAWSGLLPGSGLSAAALRPARGQIVQLDLASAPATRLIFGAMGYLVPRPDGRVLAGSTLEYVGFDKNVTEEGRASILARARRLLPGLEKARIADAWAGLRPATSDLLPAIGEGPFDGLFLATGHFRNGILLAPVTGEAVTDLVLCRAPRFNLTAFAPRRLFGTHEA
jgi:glycine oxidase